MKQAAMVPTILGFLGLFLIFTTALTLANNNAMSIRERRAETATMRVIGYHRRTILSLAVGQAIVIGLVGGLVAAAIAWTLFRDGVQLAPGEVAFLKPVKIGWPGIVVGLLASVLIPFAGALPAAVKAARLPLADALRDA
jgi:putative ABC transport system permease protein